MKQTAVEWMIENMPNIGGYIPLGISLEFQAKFDQAKEMEKQQIMKAVYDSMGTNLDPNMGRAEQYYNQTYKNK
jgi:hypothetical protein